MLSNQTFVVSIRPLGSGRIEIRHSKTMWHAPQPDNWNSNYKKKNQRQFVFLIAYSLYLAQRHIYF